MKYKLFGNSGLKVSELCLGTMTFGKEWNFGVDYETSKDIFETFAKAGGNFIDTANLYNLGTSEKWTGEFLKSDRHHFVIATKYSLYDRWDDVSFSGNNRKNMFRSLEDSLKRLGTDFIDLLWLHAWDRTTPVEEVMRGLDDLVRTGKVHYIGISNVPAWIVSQANTLAHFRGWTSFTGLQIEYSLIERNSERELLPMAKAFNIAVTPWAPLGGGVLTGKYLKKEEGRIKDPNHRRRSIHNNEIVNEVVSVAKELGVTPGQVAINWTRQRSQVVIPIVGATSVRQIEDSLGSTEFVIPEPMMKRLDEVSRIFLGYPHDFLNSDMQKGSSFGGTYDQIEFDKQ
jgi:aryl-alcohol dehydrogenase-like predicted oxidoreductase